MSSMKCKRVAVVDKTIFEIDDNLNVKPICYKGRVVKVIELNDFNSEFLDHQFSSENLKIMFWSQKDIELDYIGG